MFSSARILGVAALVAAFAAPAAVLAQQAPAAPPAGAPAAGARHGHHHNGYMRALRTLDLSDAQKQQIKTAAQQTRQANQNADPATRKANGQKLRAQIDGILTADQRTRLQAAIQQQRQMQRTSGAAPVPAPTNAP